MANLLDLANKVKQFISAGPQNVSNGLRQVGNFVNNTAAQVNDNQGWYRQGQFTPLQQISSIAKQVNTPQLQQQFQSQSTKNLSDFATQYVGNRYVAPITQMPFNLNQIKQSGSDFIKKPNLNSAGQYMGGVMGLLGGAASIVPDPVQDLTFPAYDYLKGVKAAQLKGEGTIQSYKTGLSSLSGQKVTGLGDAFSTDPKQQAIGNLAELPIVLGTLHNIGKNKAMAEQFKQLEPDILRALHGIKNYDSWKVPTQMEVLGEITSLAKKLVPDVIRNSEMKLMETREPVRWANTVGKFLADRLMKAKSPEVNVGFNVNNLKKISEENLLPWETPKYLKANPRPEFMNGSPKPPKGVEDFTREEVKNNANFALAKSDAEAKGGPFDKIFAQWIGKRESSKTKATVTASGFVKAPGDPMSIIKAIENPEAKVGREQSNYIKKLRGVYDKLFADAKAAGVDMNYLKDYITHIWDRPVNEVMGLYKDAKQKFKFSGERLVPTYEEGIKMGLTPKFSHPALILEDYIKKLEETKANLDLFTNLKKEKIVVPGSTARNNPNFLPINAPGFPASNARIDSGHTYVGNWYAPAEIAKKINQVFTPQDYGTAGKVVGGMAKISGKIQDLTMSGGIPGTPLNAWSFAQIQKEVLAGRITSPIKAILKSLPGAGATDLFKAEAPTIIRMQENNLPINTTFNIAGLVDPKYIKQTLGEKVGKLWNQLANEATFKKFSPQLMINMFKDVEKSVLDSGKSAQEASQIAANSVRQFYGLPGTNKAALANSFVEDLKGAVFFAPHYRQSMINFWVNNLKSLTNPLAKENQNNAKFMVGALLTYLAMNKINKDNTGNNMWENTTGNEDKMLIKTPDGYVKIPFLSSIATVPRTGFKIAKNVVQGDLPQALSEGKNLLSSLIRPPLDVMTNKDYFGRDITDPNSPSWADRGLYLAGQYNHPYTKAALNTFGENLPKDVKTKLNISSTPKPAYQTVIEALELPIRFMNNKPGQDALSTARYFDDREQITKSLDKGSLDLWNVLHPQKTEGRVLDNTTISSVQRATILLNNPQVRAAEELLAGQQKARGEQVDPIWNLTPQQRQMIWASQVQLPGQKNTYDTYLGKQSWYKPFQQERSAFFDSLPKSTSSAPVDSSKMAYPQPSPEVQAQMDAKNWKDPGVQAWFAARDQYNNQQLLALGLPPIESNGFGSGGGGGKKPKKVTIAKASIKKLPSFKLTSSGKRKLSFKLAKPPSTKMAKGSSTKMKSYRVAKATKIKPSKLAAFKIARKGSILA